MESGASTLLRLTLGFQDGGPDVGADGDHDHVRPGVRHRTDARLRPVDVLRPVRGKPQGIQLLAARSAGRLVRGARQLSTVDTLVSTPVDTLNAYKKLSLCHNRVSSP